MWAEWLIRIQLCLPPDPLAGSILGLLHVDTMQLFVLRIQEMASKMFSKES